jgi:adenine C2-methylase RlmN of 23S rRNA A2503 and tRNA A37
MRGVDRIVAALTIASATSGAEVQRHRITREPSGITEPCSALALALALALSVER